MKTYLSILITIFILFNIIASVEGNDPKIAESAPSSDKPTRPKVSPMKKKSSNEIEKLGKQKLL